MRDPEQIDSEVWVSCLALAGLGIIFLLGLVVGFILS